MSSMPDWMWWPLDNPFKKEEKQSSVLALAPSIPTVAPPAVTETVPTTEEELEEIKEEEKKKLKKGKEKRSTLLTGPLGILTEVPVSRKTLLGE